MTWVMRRTTTLLCEGNVERVQLALAAIILQGIRRDINMTRKMPVGLILCVGLTWMMSQGLTQKSADTESVRLIESIQGPALYQAYCAVCHGKDGRGGGPMAKSLIRPPRT